ncbi:MAG: hypothetical protein WC455_10565 [Dehalococcoidia bacterium]|jgi:hypothetical protein
MKNDIINQLEVKLFYGSEMIGYTDSQVIHVNGDLSMDEMGVVVTHELGHILLRHAPKSKERGYDNKIANVAGDAEIAMTLYDDVDEDIIGKPRSPLNGGITRKWVEENAHGCVTFEEVYEHLMKSRDDFSLPDIPVLPINHDRSQDDGTGQEKAMISSDVADAKERLMKEIKKIKIIDMTSSKNVNKHLTRKGIADYVMDVFLEALDRKPSWRRISRRLNDPFLKKGKCTVRARPRVNVYLDRSGSFDHDKTAEAERKLAELSRRYGYLVRFDTFFFGSYLSEKDDIKERGTNYEAVMDHIISLKPRLAVVITDDDQCDELPKAPKEVKIVVQMIGCSKSNFAEKAGAATC